MTLAIANIGDIVKGIVPMLADTTDVPIESLAGTHYFEQKLDGIRALAAWDSDGLTMRNRSGRDITANYLDLEMAASGVLDTPVILDGEIVARSGSFQDMQFRDKQKAANVAAAMAKVPVTFVAFDVLWHPQHADVRHLPYVERRALLQGLGLSGSGWDTALCSTDPGFYDTIRQAGGEGVVAKRLTARYTQGRRPDWLKFKSKHSVTCIGVGYEPGKGARAEFGALFLAMLRPGAAQPVLHVGKVGSGFTLPGALEMKALLDSGQAPLVEVECLGKTRLGQLRQPVFKGIRTDLVITTDALASQLDNLPTT